MEKLVSTDQLSDHAQLLACIPEPEDAVGVAHFIAVGMGRTSTWNSGREGRKSMLKSVRQLFHHLCRAPKDVTELEPEECSDHAKPGVDHMPFCHDFK